MTVGDRRIFCKFAGFAVAAIASLVQAQTNCSDDAQNPRIVRRQTLSSAIYAGYVEARAAWQTG